MKKKLFAALIVGYLVSEVQGAYQMGYFHRAKQAFKEAVESEEPLSISEFYEYIAQAPWPFGGKEEPVTEAQSEKDGADIKLWFERVQRIRAMSAEGYIKAEIAHAMGISEETVQAILEPPEERYFRVTLSLTQHAIVEVALRQLNTDDEKHAAENGATLKAFLDTTEEVA